MEVGIVRQVDIDQEMRGAYLDYAMSVITARALPDVRDGLKPVQRRILYAMGEMGVRHNTPYRKSARIVGDVLGRYHPHGDASIYEALVRMAQDFSLRYLLVDGQGNFGSVDGDPPAAMRYTEARLHAVAEEMLLDIDKDTVDFTDNFDATMKEPTVLPAKLPNLLLNGAAGIAVGMATNIPPHNLREIVDAISHLIDHPEATGEDLGAIVLGPDFPTGGIIMGLEGIKAAYATGRGRILVRAKAFIEEAKGERQNIIVTELPYQVNKATLQERIAELVKGGRIDGIGDMRDESDRQGMRVVLELKKGVEARTVLNLLYKYTAMQSTFGVNLLALVDGEPRVLTLKRILQLYIDYRHQVITRRTRFDLAKAQARAHILEGLKIALDHMDEVIATIRQSPDAETAKSRLMKQFKLDDLQAQAILDMQLRRLARLERDKIEQELKEVRKLIAYLEDLLAHPKKIFAIIQSELLELREKYGDDRRTRIFEQEALEFKAEDLIPDDDMVVALTQKGYIKRYRLPRRINRPTLGKENDPEREFCVANMHDGVLFLTDTGRVCQARCHEIPEADRSAKGTPIGNLISLDAKEAVVSLLELPKEPPADASLAVVTRTGRIKRIAAGEFTTVRGSGVIAIGLDEGDGVVAGRLSSAKQDLLLVTRQGQVLRFPQDDVRAMGRQAGGVAGMRLAGKGDSVVGLDVAQPNGHFLVVTESGQAKRTPMAELPVQGRGGGGVAFVKVSPKTGVVVSARRVAPGDEIAVGTSEGQLLRGPAEAVPEKGRGHSLEALPELKLAKGEQVTNLAVCRGESEPKVRGGDEPADKGRGKGKATAESAAAKPRARPSKSAPKGAKAPPEPAAEPTGRRKRGAARAGGAPGDAAPARPGRPPAPATDQASAEKPPRERGARPKDASLPSAESSTEAEPHPAGKAAGKVRTVKTAAAAPAVALTEAPTRPTVHPRTPKAGPADKPPASAKPGKGKPPVQPATEPSAAAESAPRKRRSGKAATAPIPPADEPALHAPLLAPWRQTQAPEHAESAAIPARERARRPEKAAVAPSEPATGSPRPRVLPAPPPLTPPVVTPRVAPKAPAAASTKAAKAPAGAAKPQAKVAAPATPAALPAKPAAAKGAGNKPPKGPVEQMALPMDQASGSATKAPQLSSKAVAKPLSRPAPAKGAGSGGSAGAKPAPEGKTTSASGKVAPRPGAAKPRAAAAAPPIVDERVEPKRAGQDDILIRFRGGKVGWMQRDK
jgi:DNA gyrase subunit A